MSTSTKTKETQEIEEKSIHCLACGTELHRFSILVCAECLDDECGKFMKMTEDIDIEK
jgi:hypothetical protein